MEWPRDWTRGRTISFFFRKSVIFFAKRTVFLYNNKSCRCGEIGRHDRLKIYCRKKRVGSSPTTGTKGYPAMLVKSMAFFLTTIDG